MSLGTVKFDLHSDTIRMQQTDEGFQFGNYAYTFYENSKEGLKQFLRHYAFDSYPRLYISNRVYFSDDEAKKKEEQYHNALSHVVWTDNPDVSFVPQYDSKTKSQCYTEQFDLKRTGVRRELNKYLSKLTAGGKYLVINSINLIHTHYYGMNEKEVQVEVSVINNKKELLMKRAEIKAKEEAAAKAEAELKAKAEAEEKAAIDNANQLILNTEFGKGKTIGGHKYWDQINKWVREGKITEQFLNAKSIDDLIPLTMKYEKDHMRIAGILEKANTLYKGSNQSYLAGIDIWKAKNLAATMSAKIKDEAKRKARHDIAYSIGAGFIGCNF